LFLTTLLHFAFLPSKTEDQVRSPVSPCEIYGGKNWGLMRFFLSAPVFNGPYHTTNDTYSSHLHAAFTMRKIG
jgi:hypothetical protein